MTNARAWSRDRLQDASLVFASCGDSNVFWPGIVEKAYAKLHGSYSILQGGSVADALVDLTGNATPLVTRRVPRTLKIWQVVLR
jgi:hypothetical protein